MASEGRKAKATKKTSDDISFFELKSTKSKRKKKGKKSALFTVYAIILVIAVFVGYFVTSANVKFTPHVMKLNGEACQELDYIEIDLSALREDIIAKNGDSPITAETIAAYADFDDGGVSATFFGKELTVHKTLLYREDLSKEAKTVDKIDYAAPGVYYIEYTCDHFAFIGKNFIKTVYVTGVEIDG